MGFGGLLFGLISYRASKTKSVVEIPMHPKLQAHLESMAGDSAGTISPTLARQKIPGRSGLSRQFMEIMRAAGIDPGKVDGKNRTFSKLSFHSLRHGFVSAMANAGIAPELRQKLAGHSSGGSHRKYTHLELWPLREAIGKIPYALSKPKKKPATKARPKENAALSGRDQGKERGETA